MTPEQVTEVVGPIQAAPPYPEAKADAKPGVDTRYKAAEMLGCSGVAQFSFEAEGLAGIQLVFSAPRCPAESAARGFSAAARDQLESEFGPTAPTKLNQHLGWRWTTSLHQITFVEPLDRPLDEYVWIIRYRKIADEPSPRAVKLIATCTKRSHELREYLLTAPGSGVVSLIRARIAEIGNARLLVQADDSWDWRDKSALLAAYDKESASLEALLKP